MGDYTRADNSGFRNHVHQYINLKSHGELDPQNYDPSSKWQTDAMRAQYKEHADQARKKYGIEGGHTVEVADASEVKESGLIVRAARCVYNWISGLFASDKHLDDRDMFVGVDLSQLNRVRGSILLQSLSEGEFKYLRGILASRVKDGEDLDKEQIKRDFKTLSKDALFAKYGGARCIVGPLNEHLGDRAAGVCKKIAESFTETMLGKSGSKEASVWKQSMEHVREEALEAARKAPEGEKEAAAKAVFEAHCRDQKMRLCAQLSDAGNAFAVRYGGEIQDVVTKYEAKLLANKGKGIPSIDDKKLREQLFHAEIRGLEHGLNEALQSARSFYQEGVGGILMAFDQTWDQHVPGMLDDVVAEANAYHEDHGASNLSTEKKQEMEKKAEFVNERRLESMEAGGIKFDNVMMDSAEDRADAYEKGQALFKPIKLEDYDELEGVSDFFEQMETEAAEAAEKAQREAEIAALAAEKKAVRANIKSNEELLAGSMMEGSDVSVSKHFTAQREVNVAKKEDKRLELEIVKIQAYADEKQALVDELEQKRQEPGFGDLSAWLDGFFSERIEKVRADRADINGQILAIKKNSLNADELAEEKALGEELAALMEVDDFTKEQAARFNEIEDRHQFLASLNMTYDELTDLRMSGKLTDDQRVRLEAMEAKIENLRQKQAVCVQTIKVIEQVREDYAKELSASRYSDPHADEPEAGTLERVKYNQEKRMQETRAALQVDLPELTDEELLGIQSGLVEVMAKSPLESGDVIQIMDLIDKIPAEKADAVLEALLEGVEDKEILFATLLTNKAFVSLYQGVRDDISRATELSRNRSIELSNRRDAEQRLLYFTQVSGKVQALCHALSGDPGSVATKMQAAVRNLSDKEVRRKKGFFGGAETVMVFEPDSVVRNHLTTMAAKARRV